jgi:hypothetical protein
MPQVQFDFDGKKYRADVTEDFFNVPQNQQQQMLFDYVQSNSDIETSYQESLKPEGVVDTAIEYAGDVVESVADVIPQPVKDVAGAIGSGTMEVLHQLGRPASAMVGGIYNIMEELDSEANGRSDWDRYVNETLEDMKKGFTYEKERHFQDLIARSNPEWVSQHPVLSTIAGIAGDIAVDPLNLLGLGVVRNLASKGTQKIGSLIESTEVGKQVIESADNPVFRAFNVYTGDKKKARELYLDLLDKVKGEHAKIVRDQKIESNMLRDSAKQLGISVEDLNRQILREVEGKAIAERIPADLTGPALEKAKQEAGDMSEMFRGFLTSEKADVPLPDGSLIKGIDIGDLADRAQKLGVKGYIPHILSEVGEKKLPVSVRDVFRYHPSKIRRELSGTIEDAELKFGKDFFVKDPTIIKAVRGARNIQAIASKEFLTSAAQSLGRKVDDAPPGWMKVDGIEGVVFDPNVAPMLQKMYSNVNDPEKFGAFLKFTDGATRWWKMWSLGLRPAYHARNVVGNLWNAYNIGGMTNPNRFYEASRIQNQSLVFGKGGRFSGNVKLGKFGTASREDIWKMATEDGVLNHGQYGGDLGRNIEQFAINSAPKNAAQELAAWVTPSTKNKFLKGGFATGRALENNTRLALYMDTLAKTGSRSKARANVKKSLFDYGDLSDFEQDVMRRFIPFYTWSRKNIPAQIEAMIKSPQRAAKLDQVIDNIQYGIDTPSLDEISEHIRERSPVFVDKFITPNEDAYNVITLLNYIPVFDLDRLYDWSPIREGGASGSGMPFPGLIAEMTNPYLRAPLEYIFNYDTYRRRDLQNYEGQKVDMLGMRVPVPLAHLAQNLVMVSELDRLNPGGVFGENLAVPKDATPEEIKKIQDSRYAKFKPFWQEEKTQRASRTDAPVSFRLLQYLAGIRPYEVEADAEKWEKLSIVSDIRKLQRFLMKEARKNNVQNVEQIKKLMRDIGRTVGDE